MIKIKRNLDISKVLQSHSEIVHDENRLLGAPLRSVFLGSDLVSWLQKHYNPINTDREGITKLVHEELCDPTLPHQLIYPVNDEPRFLDSKKHFYRFMEDQYIEFKKDSSIINLHGLDTSLCQFFYEQEEESSVFQVIDELNDVIKAIYNEFAQDNGTKINYNELIDSEIFNSKYVALATRLAYVDLSPLISNDHHLKAFFINLYNIFSIHVILARYGSKKKFGITTLERLETFNTYKYNIGGHNYTLNDILHGILRGNDSAGSGVPAATMQYLFKAKSTPNRFKESDPRYKFVLRNPDPRIHFALNYGAISCPPFRHYNAIEIEEQLESAAKEFCATDAVIVEKNGKKFILLNKLFKYYYMDFGKNNLEILQFLSKYKLDENDQEEIKNAIEKKSTLPFEFKKFEINTNISKVNST